MTENEFIKEKQKVLKSMPDTICFTREEAKSILEELERYRSIGTAKELKELKESTLSGLELAAIAIGIKELKKYEAIGTVEECREAVEKQKAKTPYVWGDGYSDGKPVYDMYDCLNCGTSYEIECDHYKYCPECGQKLNLQGCFNE